MNVSLLATKLVATVRQDGLQAALGRVLRRLRDRAPVVDPFDRVNGTETGGLEPLWRLDIESPNARFGERYEATGEAELVAALSFLGEDLERLTFIDIGCGKGRTLLVAASQGFGRVIGIEFARELALIAERNLRRRQVANATVVHADAADYEFPAQDMVLYLYNPFSEEVMRRLLEHLQAAGAHRLYLIYKQPRCARLLDECRFLVRRGQPPDAPHMHIWASHV